MFNVTGGEIIIIVLVALVVLGPDRLPEVARNLGRLINKVKSMTEGLQDTVSGISDDPAMKPIKDLSELAVRPRQKLAEYAREAEAEERANRQAEERAHFEAARAAQEALEGESSDNPETTEDLPDAQIDAETDATDEAAEATEESPDADAAADSKDEVVDATEDTTEVEPDEGLDVDEAGSSES